MREIFLLYYLLPQAFFIFQFPPPFAKKANIYFSNILNAQPPFSLAFADGGPSYQMIFSLLTTSLPKEGSSLTI